MPLRLEVEDVYFITGLPYRGEVVKLRAREVGDGLTIEECIVVYYHPDIEKVESQVPVTSIQSLSLKVIVLLLGRIEGLASLHQDSKPLMFYAFKCMRMTIYDWSTSLLANMK